MTIEIEKNTTLADVQKAFSKEYPFLKIDPAGEAGDKANVKLPAHTPMCNICDADITPNQININGSLTIAELENYFKSTWNLPVQIMRSAGNVWVRTSLTKDWTLSQQNSEGELLSKEPAFNMGGFSTSPNL